MLSRVEREQNRTAWGGGGREVRKCSREIRHFLKKLASEVKDETERQLESGTGGGRTEHVCVSVRRTQAERGRGARDRGTSRLRPPGGEGNRIQSIWGGAQKAEHFFPWKKREDVKMAAPLGVFRNRRNPRECSPDGPFSRGVSGVTDWVWKCGL